MSIPHIEITDLDRKPLPRLRMSEEEFDEFIKQCDENFWVEWVDGEVIMAPPASAAHVRLVRFILTVMTIFVEQHKLGEVLGPELQIRHAALRRRRVPDVLFISKERMNIVQKTYVVGAPDLIVEVVSPDSVARDWRDKYLEYEAAGVREYWVVDPVMQRVEAYALGTDQKYTPIEELDGMIRSVVLPGFYLKPAWLWQDPLPDSLDVLRELGVL